MAVSENSALWAGIGVWVRRTGVLNGRFRLGRAWRPRAVWLVACSVACLVGCADPRPRNVLLITLDTTRADHLGAYGYTEARTPHLDELAAAGTLYERAYAAAPETLPSHASLMTGLYPPSHGARLNGTYELADSVTTLAEILSEESFFTAAVVSAAVLAPQFGVDQGFDVYDPTEGLERSAEEVSKRGVELFDEAGERPFFLWLHYYDAHSPFRPPAEFLPESAGEVEPESVEQYDGEIAYVDHWVGEVLAHFRSSGRLEQTLVVVVADHGESLGDHGETYHTHFVYDSTIRVPLILSGPGVPVGQRIAQPVASLDIFASVLARFGIEPPPSSSVGLPGLEGRNSDRSAPRERGLFSETQATKERYGWHDLTALRTSDWLYVKAPQEELYPADAPPGAVNLLIDPSREQSRALQSMRRLLESTSAQMPPAPSSSAPGRYELSEEEERKLAALGYLSASGTDLVKDEKDLADPKDMIEVAESIALARYAMRQGRLPLADDLLSWASAVDPENGGILLQRGRVLSALQRLEEAREELEGADRLRPASTEILVELAAVEEALGETEAASLHFQAALTVTKVPVETWLGLARAHFRARNREAGRAALESVLELDAGNKEALALRERASRFEERAAESLDARP